MGLSRGYNTKLREDEECDLTEYVATRWYRGTQMSDSAPRATRTIAFHIQHQKSYSPSRDTMLQVSNLGAYSPRSADQVFSRHVVYRMHIGGTNGRQTSVQGKRVRCSLSVFCRECSPILYSVPSYVDQLNLILDILGTPSRESIKRIGSEKV